jgi:hypothetical protein
MREACCPFCAPAGEVVAEVLLLPAESVLPVLASQEHCALQVAMFMDGRVEMTQR